VTEADDPTAALIALLTKRGLTIAVAESLTGGALTAELIRIPGASVVVAGGIVAYQTALKHTLLDVDAALLAEHGPVHPEVAAQMARGARTRLSLDGRPVDIGVATTGVAGPDPQGGRPPGTVYLGLSAGPDSWAAPLTLVGDRSGIRAATVAAAVEAVYALVAGNTAE
jgi:nicotinamide-nucleotide amidase